MAYIGKIEAGAVNHSLLTGNKYAGKFTAGSSFTASIMGFYAGSSFATTEKVKLAIYADSSGVPGDLLGVSDEITAIGIQQNFAWYHADLSSTVSITSGTSYWLTIISDNNISISADSTGGNIRYNSNTYASGFSDPFGGGLTSDTEEYSIYAADSLPLISHGNLAERGSVFRTSTGTIIGVFVSPESVEKIEVWKDIDTTAPALLLNMQTGPNVHGAAGNISAIDAAIDSNDVIHVISASSTDSTRDIAYNTISNLASTPAWGTWEEAASYTDTAPNVPGVSISIDSNDKPHIVFVDRVKQAGSAQNNVYYTEKTGASWATPTQMGARITKTDVHSSGALTLRSSDSILVTYRVNLTAPGHEAAYRTYTSGGGWSGETQDDLGSSIYARLSRPLATSGDTLYRYHTEGASAAIQDIHENNGDVAYNTSVQSNVSALSVKTSPVLNGTDRYIFYIDTGADVHLISNSGSGWTDEGDLQTGTYTGVIAGWSYNNLNNTTTIDYLYTDGTNVYYGEKTFGTDASDSQAAYIKGENTDSDNKAAYIAGGVQTSDNQSAYINGAFGSTDNKAAYIKGLAAASARSPAYIAGSLAASDSQQAYITGALGATDNKSAYIKGSLDDLDNKEAYIAGSLDALDNREAYLKGQDTADDNLAAYLKGQDTADDNLAAYLKGQDTASSRAFAYIQGDVLEATDSASAYIAGSLDTQDNTPAYIAGSLDTDSNVEAYIKGQDVSSDNQSAYTKGQDTTDDSQPAYVAGGINVSDSQASYIAGGVEVAGNQPAYIAGGVETVDSQPAYVAGGINVTDSKSAYIAGGVEVSDSLPAYVAGGVNVASNQQAYIKGATPTSDSASAYIEGLYLPLPVTEPWTGSDDDEWRRSHWVAEVIE